MFQVMATYVSMLGTRSTTPKASFVKTLAIFFFFNDTATTEIYTLSLHDALPIYLQWRRHGSGVQRSSQCLPAVVSRDRKSTRLNSSHANISYAVFCLKKKNIIYTILPEIIPRIGNSFIIPKLNIINTSTRSLHDI